MSSEYSLTLSPNLVIILLNCHAHCACLCACTPPLSIRYNQKYRLISVDVHRYLQNKYYKHIFKGKNWLLLKQEELDPIVDWLQTETEKVNVQTKEKILFPKSNVMQIHCANRNKVIKFEHTHTKMLTKSFHPWLFHSCKNVFFLSFLFKDPDPFI